MMDMATRVEVSRVRKRRDASGQAIEGLGGIWLDRPWYMSEQDLIREIRRPDDRRQWDFFIAIDGESVPITIASTPAREYLTATGKPFALLNLPEWEAGDDRTLFS
jgi:hypothetical protein